MGDFDRYERLTADLEPPYAVVDLAAFRRNADDLVRRAGGTPIRVASKSVRCRALITAALDRPGFHGVMSYSLPEALWLARNGVDDILMGYPTVHRGALRELAADAEAAARITLMIDDYEQLALIKAATGGGESASTWTPRYGSSASTSAFAARRCGPRSRCSPSPAGWSRTTRSNWSA